MHDTHNSCPHAGATGKTHCPYNPAAISIHAPLTGYDLGVIYSFAFTWSFQSTHPSRGATFRPEQTGKPGRISIHAPLTGCDKMPLLRPLPLRNFNPRTPHGVRPTTWTVAATVWAISIHAPLTGCDEHMVGVERYCSLFQSTHPSRGATYLVADRRKEE